MVVIVASSGNGTYIVHSCSEVGLIRESVVGASITRHHPCEVCTHCPVTLVVPDDSWNSSTQTDRFRSGVRPSVVRVFIHSLSPSYTLWDFGAYRLSPPLVQDHTSGIVCDSPTTRDGTESTPTIVKFHREVPLILKNLRV